MYETQPIFRRGGSPIYVLVSHQPHIYILGGEGYFHEYSMEQVKYG